MKDFFRAGILILGGIFVGFYIYANFGMPAKEKSKNDSLLVDQLYAQASLADSNQQIYKERSNVITRAVSKIAPAVVSVNVMQVKEYLRRSPFRSRDPILREFFPELFKDQYYQEEIESLGSGFIISSDGYILTNDHVVKDATKIVVTLPGGEKMDAEMVGTDPPSDIALLKVDPDADLPYIPMGNSDDVIIGEWAIAIGNPFGLFELYKHPTVTVGVVSAVDRDFGNYADRYYQDMIQTDASINRGNSGGPLCNAIGQVIGMNTFIYTGSRYSEGSVGIGFAIPINRIKRIVNDLKQYKKVDRDFWVGLKVSNLNSFIARKIGYNSTNGVVITSIDRSSPAEKAGLQLEDVIIEIAGNKVKNDGDIIEVIFGSDLKVGDEIELKIWRDGEILELQMELSKQPGT